MTDIWGPWRVHVPPNMPEGLTQDDLIQVMLVDCEEARAEYAFRWDWRNIPDWGKANIALYRAKADHAIYKDNPVIPQHIKDEARRLVNYEQGRLEYAEEYASHVVRLMAEGFKPVDDAEALWTRLFRASTGKTDAIEAIRAALEKASSKA